MIKILAAILLSFTVSSGHSAEIKEVITGRGSEVTTGPFGVIADPNFDQIEALSGINLETIFLDEDYSHVITLGVYDKYTSTAESQYNLKVTYAITPFSNSNNELLTDDTFEFSLSTSYIYSNSGVKENYKSAKKLEGYRKVLVNIVSIEKDDTPENGEDNYYAITELPGNAYVEAFYMADRSYKFDFNSVPGVDETDYFVNHHFLEGIDQAPSNGSLIGGSPTALATDMRITWDHISGADFYELEWTYINDYKVEADGSVSYLSENEIGLTPIDFKNNSSRIITDFLHFDIPLTFDHGYVIYRVRGVGKSGPVANPYGHLIPGKWSSDLVSNQINIYDWPHKVFVNTSHENNKNWQLVTTFAEDGKKKEVISYYDGLNRNRQVVTRINSEKESVVAETIYDYHGRAAINILPTPAFNSTLGFHESFNQNLSGTAYSAEDFDLDLNECEAITASAMTSSSGASKYYSANSVNGTYQDYTPNAYGYAFSQVQYTPDNTGRVRAQGGVGQHHQLSNDGKNTKYFYNPAQQYELDRLFGYEVGFASRYKKNIVVDPNGQVSVSYVDAHGRTIATALAGRSPEQLSELENLTLEPDTPDSYDLLDGATWDNNSVSSDYMTTITPVNSNSPNSFSYNASIPAFSNECMGADAFTVIYDIDYSLTDMCGAQLFEHQYTQGSNLSSAYVDDDLVWTLSPATSFTSNISPETHGLDIESYNLSRSISMDENALDLYAEYYVELALENCITEDDTYLADQIAAITESVSCGDLNCETCAWDVQVQYNAGFYTEEERDFLLAECEELCEVDNNYCTMNRELMLMDVSPSGQYGPEASPSINVFTGLASSVDRTVPPVIPYRSELGNYSLIELTLIPEDTFYPEVNAFSGIGNVIPVQMTDISADISSITITDIYNHLYGVLALSSNAIVELDGGYYTLPSSLAELDDFLNYWEGSWAESLLPYHPEYCYLQACQSFETSSLMTDVFLFDEYLMSLEEGDAVFGSNYLAFSQNLLNINTGLTDPLVNVMSASALTSAEDDIEYYAWPDGGINTGTLEDIYLSMYEVAGSSSDCGNWFGNDACMPLFDSYAEWRLFLGMYIGARQEWVKDAVVANGAGCSSVPSGMEKRYWAPTQQLVDPGAGQDHADEVGNTVNYALYSQTGVCPLANSFFEFLTEMASDKSEEGFVAYNLMESTALNLLDISSFNYMLYHHMSGGNMETSYLHPKWSLTENVNQLVINIHGVDVLDVYGTIELSNIPDNLLDLNDLRFLEFNVLSSSDVLSTFEALIEYGDGLQAVLSGEVDLDLENCLEWTTGQNSFVDPLNPDPMLGEFYQECQLNDNGQDILEILNIVNSIVNSEGTDFITNYIGQLSEMSIFNYGFNVNSGSLSLMVSNNLVNLNDGLGNTIQFDDIFINTIGESIINLERKDFVNRYELTYTNAVISIGEMEYNTIESNIDVFLNGSSLLVPFNNCAFPFGISEKFISVTNSSQNYEASLAHIYAQLDAHELYGRIFKQICEGRYPIDIDHGNEFILGENFPAWGVEPSEATLEGMVIIDGDSFFGTGVLVGMYDYYSYEPLMPAVNESLIYLPDAVYLEVQSDGVCNYVGDYPTPNDIWNYSDALCLVYSNGIYNSNQGIFAHQYYEPNDNAPVFMYSAESGNISPEYLTPTSNCELIEIPLTVCNQGAYDTFIDGMNAYDGSSIDNSILGINLGSDLYNFNAIGGIVIDATEDFSAAYEFPSMDQFCNYDLAPYAPMYVDYLTELQTYHTILNTGDPLYMSLSDFAAGNYQLYVGQNNGNTVVASYLDYLAEFQTELNLVFTGTSEEELMVSYEAFDQNPYLITLQEFVSGGYTVNMLADYSAYKLDIETNNGTHLYPIEGWVSWAGITETAPNFCSAFPSSFPILDITAEDSCDDYINELAAANTEIYMTTLTNQLMLDFKAQYKEHALSNLNESLIHEKLDQEYHHTLYYYDLAGNLIRTTPPAGAVLLDKDGAEGYEAVGVNRKLNPADDVVNITGHALNTYYEYNTLNQLIWQSTPDGGETNFYYDELGRLVCSQNAEQGGVVMNPIYIVSYTLFDELGRIKEVGQKSQISNPGTGFISPFTGGHQVNYEQFEAHVNAGYSGKEQVVYTYFDAHNVPVSFNSGESQYLRNRVASVVKSDRGSEMDYEFATHYKYDIHGNVEELVQEIAELAPLNQNYKHTEYDFDLVSGNVHEVHYQDGETDQFHHKYSYDGDNRIVAAYTSNDDLFWERDAKYYYYKHGPLARIETGDDIVQGSDYAYTIHGWLKGVNSNHLTSVNDMGSDGLLTELNQQVPVDEFGFSLGYFRDDYAGIAEEVPLYDNWLVEKSGHSLFNEGTLHNGNISHMVTSIQRFIEAGEKPLLMGYTYDQLNRITSSKKYLNMDATFVNNMWAPAYTNDYATSYTYDPNGNIKRLTRNGYFGLDENDQLMDNIDYQYLNGNNQLSYVTDDQTDVLVGSELKYPSALTAETSTYEYDNIGNLISDSGEHIAEIQWTVTGKVAKVIREDEINPEDNFGPDLEFRYDAMGNRVVKITKPAAEQNTWNYTFYVRDAQGNVMSTYDKYYGDYVYAETTVSLELKEQHIYGSSRVGLTNANTVVATVDLSGGLLMDGTFDHPGYSGLISTPFDGLNHVMEKGDKSYEFSNHLGNVLVVVSDQITPDPLNNGETAFSSYRAVLQSAQNYYPFGMVMPGCSDGGTSTQMLLTEVEKLEDTYAVDLEGWEGCNFANPTVTVDETMKIDGAVVSTDLAAFLAQFGLANGEYFEQVCARKVLSVGEQLSSGEHQLYLNIADLSLPNEFELRIKLIGDGTPENIEYDINEGQNIFTFSTTQNVTEIQFAIGFEMFGIQNGNIGIEDQVVFMSAIGNLNYSIEIEDTKVLGFEEVSMTSACPQGAYVSSSYRYGFNGMEKDNEMKGLGNSYDFGARIYDARLGRFLSLDPKASHFPFMSPYCYAANMPIIAIDENGEGPIIIFQSLSASRQVRGHIKRYTDDEISHKELMSKLNHHMTHPFRNFDDATYARKKSKQARLNFLAVTLGNLQGSPTDQADIIPFAAYPLEDHELEYVTQIFLIEETEDGAWKMYEFIVINEDQREQALINDQKTFDYYSKKVEIMEAEISRLNAFIDDGKKKIEEYRKGSALEIETPFGTIRGRYKNGNPVSSGAIGAIGGHGMLNGGFEIEKKNLEKEVSIYKERIEQASVRIRKNKSAGSTGRRGSGQKIAF